MAETEKIEVESYHHDHPLTLISHDKPYRCDGCKTESSGLRYRCEPCNFDLHEECTFTAHETASYHDFFPGCAFRFFRKPPKSRRCTEKEACANCLRLCNACGYAVDGFVYHGQDKDLHPRCFELKRSIHHAGDDVDVEFRLRDTVERKCTWCKKRKVSEIRGWSYVSGCGEYHLHVQCVTEAVMAAWNKDDDVSKCLALANLDSMVVDRRGKKGSGGRTKFVTVVKVLVKTFALILFGFGEPTISIALLLAELITS